MNGLSDNIKFRLSIISMLLVFGCCSTYSQSMVYVEGGEALIGNEEYGIPERHIRVDSFYLSKYEVTIFEWKEFIDASGLEFEWNNEYWGDILDFSESEKAPIQYVQWWQAILYCNWLSKKNGFMPVYEIKDRNVVYWNQDANGYRLPTETEWEFAAKGGLFSKGYAYSGSNNPLEVGWFKENAGDISMNVGTKKPNELGIYDMSGNIDEWCWDSVYWVLYRGGISDLTEEEKRNSHVIKGGGARSYFIYSKVFERDSAFYDSSTIVGLRVARNEE